MAARNRHVREERDVETDVDASPVDVLVDLDVDVDVDAEVDVGMDSVVEDGELEPVAASVAPVLTVINRQTVSEIMPFSCLRIR
jgi:hypothetical protein